MSLYVHVQLYHTLIAVGEDDSVTNVPAASYLTAAELEFSRL